MILKEEEGCEGPGGHEIIGTLKQRNIKPSLILQRHPHLTKIPSLEKNAPNPRIHNHLCLFFLLIA